MNYTHTSERKTVRVVAGISKSTGQPVFAENVPVIINRDGQHVTSVTILSDSTHTGRAVDRVQGANAVILS